VIIEKTMSEGWLSNSYLVADEPGGHAVLIDSGGPMEPIVAKIEELKLELTHVLCTHHHIDHVQHNAEYKGRFGCPICGHPKEASMFDSLDVNIEDGDELVSGGLHIRALHVPGHTVGQLAFLINEERVFTGDTLFRGSVGGTCAPGHATFDDIQHSIMEVLMRLPKETAAHPGHTDPTSIGQEWESNPFIRLWRGVDSTFERRCTAFGKPAVLLLDAPDYDGGRKCWVRFRDDDKLEIVPASQVKED